MKTGSGERTSPPAEDHSGAQADASGGRRTLHLPRPVPDLLRDALIARNRALGNRTRFRVWDELRDGEASVSELTERLPFSQQAVSAALLELHAAGLVEREQVASHVRYRHVDKTMEHALAIVHMSIQRRAIRFARELRDADILGSPPA